jgi:hypothetical protein
MWRKKEEYSSLCTRRARGGRGKKIHLLGKISDPSCGLDQPKTADDTILLMLANKKKRGALGCSSISYSRHD